MPKPQFSADWVTITEEILNGKLRFSSSAVTSERLKKAHLLIQRKLYEFLTVIKTVKKDILVKQDVPDVIKNVAALKYESVSYVLLNTAFSSTLTLSFLTSYVATLELSSGIVVGSDWLLVLLYCCLV